jgi:hypothetical protein
MAVDGEEAEDEQGAQHYWYCPEQLQNTFPVVCCWMQLLIAA